MRSDKRKTIYLIILLSLCIVIIVILMMKKETDSAFSEESEVRETVISQDEHTVRLISGKLLLTYMKRNAMPLKPSKR